MFKELQRVHDSGHKQGLNDVGDVVATTTFRSKRKVLGRQNKSCEKGATPPAVCPMSRKEARTTSPGSNPIIDSISPAMGRARLASLRRAEDAPQTSAPVLSRARLSVLRQIVEKPRVIGDGKWNPRRWRRPRAPLLGPSIRDQEGQSYGSVIRQRYAERFHRRFTAG